MAEYIDREPKCGECIFADFCEQIPSVSDFNRDNIAYCQAFKRAADVVEVVRCKDCKYREKTKWGGWCCGSPDYGMGGGVDLKDDDFCSYGMVGAKMDGKDGADNER